MPDTLVPDRRPDVAVIRAALKAQLPGEAFAAHPGRLLDLVGYGALAGVAYGLIRATEQIWVWALAALVLGACHLSVGLIAHDVSHGSVIRHRRSKAIVESILWGLTVTPAMVWIVSHNRVHHPNTGTKNDFFRSFTTAERTRGRTWFSLLFLPNRFLRWNPLVFQAYFVQMGMHTVAALLGLQGKVGPIPNLGRYSRADRVRLAAELGFIALFQVALFMVVGRDWSRYLWAGPVAFLIASAGASAYLATQHALHPVITQPDPFNSTSLRVPAFVDRLHSYHAHHTAHHLFPTMRSDFYPQVTALLLRDHPSCLQQRTFLDCWRRVFQNQLYAADPAQP